MDLCAAPTGPINYRLNNEEFDSWKLANSNNTQLDARPSSL